MTDEQIIEALQKCFIVGSCSGCAGCPLKPKRQEDANCIDKLVTNTIDLIKRQQAEIERLNKENKILVYRSDVLTLSNEQKENTIAELTEKIAERLKASPKINESILTKKLKAVANGEKVDCYDGTEQGDVIAAMCYDAYYAILGLKARIKEIKAEAIKEFADKLKEKAVDVGICDVQGNSFGGATVVFVGDIDNLAKEMGCGE